MSTIDDIAVTIPKRTVALDDLLKILAMCNNVKIRKGSLIQATSDKKLKPTITFLTRESRDPFLCFTGSGLGKRRFHIGKLPIYFNLDKPITNSGKVGIPSILVKSDHGGEYLEVKWPFATYDQLNFKQLYERIADQVISLDHVGVNINSRLLSKIEYEKLKKIVSESSCLCDHPSQKEWPFIIPASPEERQQGINTGVKRDPKFELVYGFAYPYPEIQLDIQTKLSPKETLALFPPPYGYSNSDPVTGDYCSSVFIYTGWQNVSLRIDLRFYVPNFSHTDWLITEGSRVR